MMRSNTNESDEAMGVDSEDSNVGSSKTGDNKQPPMKGSSDTSNEANDPSSHAASYPSSTSATVATKARRQPTAQSLILPSHKTVAATAAPAIPRSKKKSQSAGFREQFLPKLRIMLDRESQNGSAIVQWSTDGKSFIVMDQNQFEVRTIPSYFDNSIAFASFVRKLYRYGFNQLPTSRTGHYRFCSLTFRRVGTNSETAPAAATAVAHNMTDYAGGFDSTTNPAYSQASLPLLQVTAHTNHPTAPDPLVNQADATEAVFSNIQRNNQQPPLPSQQYIYGNNILQGNSDHTMNLLFTALNNLVGNQSSSDQLQGNSEQSPLSNSIIQTIMSLSGIFPAQPTFINTSTSTMSQSNAAVPPLLLLMHRLGEEERQRRAQADATQNAIMLAIGQILGGGNRNNEQERQHRAVSALVQSLQRTNNNIVQIEQGVPPPAGNLNFQANRIAAVQATQRGEIGPIQEGHGDSVDDSFDDGDDDDDGEQDSVPLSSRRKRKSPDDDEDDQYDSDDESLQDRLRPRKK